jgi:hypothetical protein
MHQDGSFYLKEIKAYLYIWFSPEIENISRKKFGKKIEKLPR